MKKFFSLVLALVMALSLTTVAWGASVDEAALVAAAETNGGTLVLDQSFTLTDMVHVKKDLVLDLNGQTITAADAWTKIRSSADDPDVHRDSMFVVEAGAKLTIIDSVGTGKITVGTVAQAELNGVVKMTFHIGNDTTKTAELVVDGGTLVGNGNAICSHGNRPNSKITISGGTVEGDVLGIYNPSGELIITGGVITGKTAVYFKGGSLTISGGTLKATGDQENYAYGGSGAKATGDALVIDNCNYPSAITDVSVTGGTFTSANAAPVASYVGNGVADADKVDEFVEGGTFSGTVDAALLADGLELTQKADGSYTTNPDETGSSTAALYDLKKANAAGDEVKGDIGYEVVAAVKDDTNGYTTGTLEYVKMDGKLFVKINKTDATVADFYVTKANEKTAQFYLKQIDSVADISYIFVAVEFTNFGYKCDQLNASYVDYVTNEVGYYVWTHPVTGDKIYFADDVVTTGDAYYNKAVLTPYTVNILVDDEVIEAYGFVDDAVSCNPVDPLNQHVWAPVAYDKTTPTKAQCGICGTQATVYKDGKAPAGSKVIDETFNQVPYDLVITSVGGGSYVPVTPSTDKVTSAATFDAGIAMYVGMSVLAATGSAVVIGKKKD